MQSIKEIRSVLEKTNQEELKGVLDLYRTDARSGVMKLIQQYDKKVERYEKEIARLEGMLSYEKKYSSYIHICGIDEAGRGPLAGPVVAGAVILKKNEKIFYLNDSKQLSVKLREELYDEIVEKAISFGIGIVSSKRIDDINILQATYEAMRMAVSKLSVRPELLLNDAVTIPQISIPQIPIIKGDAKSLSIAAASVIAKVTRDRMMLLYDEMYPEYGFASNKGYGSKAHIEALKENGISPIHRKTFLKSLFRKEESEGEAYDQ